MTEIGIVRAGPERIDDLEPLWEALHAHHLSVDPGLPGMPMRGIEDTWPRRRAEYEEWLAEPDAFALIAEAPPTSGAVGYALVHFHPADDSWRTTGDRFAELESLSVMPSARSGGVGRRLMEEAYARLRELRVRELEIGVLATNHDAIRFYDREGFKPWMIHYAGAIPGPA